MANPKKKSTRASKRNRAAHFTLKAKILTTCTVCSTRVLPHYACQKCGNYKGRSVSAKPYESVKAGSDNVTEKKTPKNKKKDTKKTAE